jgi:hypothetical protein
MRAEEQSLYRSVAAPTEMNPMESDARGGAELVSVSCCSHRDKPGGKPCAVSRISALPKV